MMITRTKTITILIAGAVFTAGLMMGLGGYVFAGDPVPGLDITIEQIPGGRVSTKNYKSSLSNTKSIGQVRMEVGNVLLRYGVGGAEINKVTEALEGGGVYEAELKSFLLAVGINEQDAQNILLEFDKIGIGKDSAQAVFAPVATDAVPSAAEGTVTDNNVPPRTDGASAPVATGAVPSAAEGTVKQILPSGSGKGISTHGTGDVPQPAIINAELHRPPTAGAGEQRFKSVDGLDSKIRTSMFIKLGTLPGEQAVFIDSATKSIQNLKAAESGDESKKIRQELEDNRRALVPAIQSVRESVEANAQDLRDNFRENVKTTIGHVDHGKTGRIAVAHGKGLRMINRYRSAIARFDHILGRLESRIEKIGTEEARNTQALNKAKKENAEADAQGRANKGTLDILTPPTSVVLLIEEAKNMQAMNKAKLVELEAKYESLLEGKKTLGYLKIDGIDGEKVFIKYDDVDGEKAFIKIEGLDGEKAMGYLKIDGIKGEVGYLKIDGIESDRIYIKIDGIEGERVFIKLGNIKGEISQLIGEEAREIAEELKLEIEKLHTKLREIADDIKQASVDYNSSRSNVKL